MKIGIITFHRGNGNYGSSLQAYHLKTVISDMGHDVFIIDYISPRLYLWMLKKARSPLQFGLLLFRNFLQKKFLAAHLSKPLYFSPQKHLKCYDALITGSDEVWKVNYLRGFDPLFFLGYPFSGTRKISYAASYIPTKEFSTHKNDITAFLSQITYLSVRENSTAQMVHELTGHKPVIVLDPTLLAELPQSDTPTLKKSRPFLYIYPEGDLGAEYLHRIRDYAAQSNLAIMSFNPQKHLDRGEYKHPLVTVDGWINQLRTSNCVITNTYHGTCLAIRYHRPFVSIAFKQKSYKTEYLLKQLGLDNRYVNDSSALTEVLHTPINWQEVDLRIQELRILSMDFLKRALD